MHIVTYYADEDSNPLIGLTPTIKLYDIISDTVAVDSATMEEINDNLDPGWYKYEFVAVDLSHTYTVMIDGGSNLSSYLRYQNAIVTPEIPLRPIVDFGN